MAILDLIQKIQNDVYKLEGKEYKFKAGKPITAEQIKKFETKNEIILASDYKEFVAHFGAAEVFGIKFFAAKNLDFSYRYDEQNLSGQSLPAEGTIVFAAIPILDDDSFLAFIFKQDLKKPAPHPDLLKVCVWAGDAYTGEPLDDIEPQSFESFLTFWTDLMKRKSK